ncbi:MAG TPA: hypothetical protein PKY05_00285 [Fibrobacteria bacterium]|nr:hypothetical protein [Fibrobacteria bacterium]
MQQISFKNESVQRIVMASMARRKQDISEAIRSESLDSIVAKALMDELREQVTNKTVKDDVRDLIGFDELWGATWRSYGTSGSIPESLIQAIEAKGKVA